MTLLVFDKDTPLFWCSLLTGKYHPWRETKGKLTTHFYSRFQWHRVLYRMYDFT